MGRLTLKDVREHRAELLAAADTPKAMGFLTTSGDGPTLRVSGEFAMPSSAQRAIDEYVARYHPAGYGTALSLRAEDRRDGLGNDYKVWVVEGSRSASCD